MSILLLFIIVDGEVSAKGFVKFLPMLLGAVSAITLKLIYESKEQKITFMRGFISLIGAVCISYLFSDIINGYISKDFAPLIIAVVVWNGEKITLYFTRKFNIDLFLTAATEIALQKLGIKGVIDKLKEKKE